MCVCVHCTECTDVLKNDPPIMKLGLIPPLQDFDVNQQLISGVGMNQLAENLTGKQLIFNPPHYAHTCRDTAMKKETKRHCRPLSYMLVFKASVWLGCFY